ncbi:MAG TPA: tRNA lysidine(34) synthetase TilS [Candidatus Dormibacteraeota bacterium]|jgi:tRNA(Ile)-lysidine synthase|nr:tRNA lysidine(34) synthetase TilS [Candidatus Dormibacteraeota bacterium]
MLEKVFKYVREQQLLRPGDRLAVACSGGADSVALLHILAELSETMGIVLSVAHFHHQIRGAEADLDQRFVEELAARLQVGFLSASGNVPEHAIQSKISVETAARELRHQWFAELIRQGTVDKIATAHTLDDQAETVLMRILRGTGVRGLAGIAAAHKSKHLVRPLLTTSRREVEAYLRAKDQCWREDSTNLDLGHTRNRIRHTLLPLLERDYNPAIRQTLTDLAELARAEDEYWSDELASLLPRLVHEGKPSRSGRSSSGRSHGILALDLSALRGFPLAIRRQVIHATALGLGVSLEFKHIQQLIGLVENGRSGAKLVLPDGLVANRTVREIQFTRNKQESPENYCYSLPIPGEVTVPELGITIRARLISDGKQKASGYNTATLLSTSLLGSKLTVRNWRAGDKFFPAHTQSPKKVKELLQPGRLGQEFSPAQRKAWPVIESAGQIVWMRSFPVSQDFASNCGDAVLIEEIKMSAEAQE